MGRMALIGLGASLALHSPLLVISQIPMEGRSQSLMEKTYSDFFLGLGEVKVDPCLHLSCFCTAGLLPR